MTKPLQTLSIAGWGKQFLNLKGNNPLAQQDNEQLLNPGIQLFTRLSFQL